MSKLFALWMAAIALAPIHGQEDALDSKLALETFDKVWKTVDEQHFDPTFNGVDWNAVGEELRPRAGAAGDTEELREVVREMLGRLKQSHFSLVPKESLPKKRGQVDAEEELAGGLGLDVRVREDRLLITSVEPPALDSGVRPGWILVSVDGVDFEELRAKALEDAHRRKSARHQKLGIWKKALLATYGKIGSRAELELLDGDGERVQLQIERTDRDVIPYSMPGAQLPTFYLSFSKQVLERGDVKVGVIHFSNWFKPMRKPIAKAMESMGDCDGIVLDLRGNTGGDGSMIGRVAGQFFNERVELGVQRMRHGSSLYIAWPQRNHFAGPLAILTDETTGSSSEVFTGGMQSVERARVFGETTAGAVLPARTLLLPNGDGLIHAIGEFETSKGDVLEGPGVLPDVEVHLNRADLLAGRDAALEAAIAWVRRQE